MAVAASALPSLLFSLVSAPSFFCWGVEVVGVEVEAVGVEAEADGG